jgi:uncharacterized protein
MAQFIIMPTLNCNAACDYCFQHRTNRVMSHATLAVIVEKLLRYLTDRGLTKATIYWQGGEVLTIPREWYIEAHRLIRELEERHGKRIQNCAQSNLLAYDETWDPIIEDFFGNNVGSSLDFPNIHRRPLGGRAETYNETILRNHRRAAASGIKIGVISVPNWETLNRGGRAFFSYYVDEAGIVGLQVNPPFSDGPATLRDRLFPLDNGLLTRFYLDLVDVWLERGFAHGVHINPLDQLVDFFLTGDASGLACEWAPDCTECMTAFDPLGNVMQCDCWTNHPEYWFGNVHDDESLGDILGSAARRAIKERPGRLMEETDCVDCRYLAICHGGCAIRALSTHGELNTKDPYCEAMRALFQRVEEAAYSVSPDDYAANRRSRGLPVPDQAGEEDGPSCTRELCCEVDHLGTGH